VSEEPVQALPLTFEDDRGICDEFLDRVPVELAEVILHRPQ
jgi:hypothetical protein